MSPEYTSKSIVTPYVVTKGEQTKVYSFSPTSSNTVPSSSQSREVPDIVMSPTTVLLQVISYSVTLLVFPVHSPKEFNVIAGIVDKTYMSSTYRDCALARQRLW